MANTANATSTFRRRVVGSAIGSFIEFYGFLVYALSAPVLALHFFPESTPFALLGTFAIFSVAFLFGPLGGLFFGYLGDRIGRVRTLSATILLMGGATLMIGLLPTFDSIGVFAPILLLLCRIAQGFAAGGECSGAYSYVLESAPDDQRARWVTFTVTFAWLGPTIASLLILGLRAIGGDSAYDEWIWRIPFLLGGVVSVVGLWVRRRLEDSAEFTEARQETKVRNPLITALRTNPRSLVLVVLLGAVNGAGAYVINGYIVSYQTEEAGIPADTALLSSAICLTLFVVLFPFFGILTDRIGRRAMLLIGSGLMLILAYPAFLLVSSGTVLGAFSGQLLLAVAVAALHAGFYPASLELFPTAVRYSGHAVSFNLGCNIVGGATPLICTVLISALGTPVAPAFFLMFTVVFAIVAALIMPETKRFNLRDSAGTASPELADNAPTPVSS
ncbi:MFS transporter [Streptomyces sp. WG-D5]